VNLELTIRQSIAKPRRIWASNFGRKGGIKKCEKREKKAPFIGEEVAAPSSWW
jgi:hypothetical protein